MTATGLWDGLLGPLLGRTKLKKPDMDRIFALATAEPSLAAAELGPGPAAAVCLRPVEGGAFAEVDAELERLVQLAANSEDFHSQARVERDELGYTWIVFRDARLEEQVSLAHLVASSLQEKGYGEQLLAALFRMTRTQQEDADGCYLVYNYKRGAFYPFIPRGERTRDNAAEFRTASALGEMLPMEADITRWFPLWDAPL